MKQKLFLLTVMMVLVTAVKAQDEMYFTPKKKTEAEKKAEREAKRLNTQGTYWVGSRRNVDEYNRRGRNTSSRKTYSFVATDSLNNDVINFEMGDGTYPDSLSLNDPVAQNPGNLDPGYTIDDGDNLYDDGYSAGYMAGYSDGFSDDFSYSRRLGLYYGYYSPWYHGYYSHWSWYDPWYYGWAGWYDPWYSWGWGWGWHAGWYDPWHYHYGWGHSWGWAPTYRTGHTGTLAGRYDRHYGSAYKNSGIASTTVDGRTAVRRSTSSNGRIASNGTSTFGTRRDTGSSTRSYTTTTTRTTTPSSTFSGGGSRSGGGSFGGGGVSRGGGSHGGGGRR